MEQVKIAERGIEQIEITINLHETIIVYVEPVRNMDKLITNTC